MVKLRVETDSMRFHLLAHNAHILRCDAAVSAPSTCDIRSGPLCEQRYPLRHVYLKTHSGNAVVLLSQKVEGHLR
jgi:hypothetical protein